jgi:serine/threonine protein kinase
MNVRAAPPVGAPGFRLIRWIVTSGAASLYMASDLASGRPAVVKIFHRMDGRTVDRLEQRLQTNAALAHPGIVPVHSIGRTSDGRLFHSMPLLMGFEQARHDLLGRPLRIAALLRGLLEGLAQAHRSGTVHGGIKPSNVLFDKQGYAQLADFGIACCMAEPGLPPRTRGGISAPNRRGAKHPTHVRTSTASACWRTNCSRAHRPSRKAQPSNPLGLPSNPCHDCLPAPARGKSGWIAHSPLRPICGSRLLRKWPAH